MNETTTPETDVSTSSYVVEKGDEFEIKLPNGEKNQMIVLDKKEGFVKFEYKGETKSMKKDKFVEKLNSLDEGSESRIRKNP